MNDIFIVPTVDEDIYIVYAPLRKVCFGVNKYTSEIFNTVISNSSRTSWAGDYLTVYNRIVDILNRNILSPRDGNTVLGTDMSIIITQRCNLGCTYCYAKESHSKQIIEFNTVKQVVDYLLNNHGNKSKHLTFIGGGEPTIEWELLKKSIDYIRNKQGDHKVYCTVITNGTLLNDEKLIFFKENNIRLVISFDVLKEHQDQLRPLTSGKSSYEIVVENLNKIHKIGVECDCIRSTITNNNVNDMNKMVEMIHEKYPFIHYLNLEPVTDKNNTSAFYEKYIESFWDCNKYGESVGITVYNSISSSLSSIKTCFCKRELCVVPNGDIVCCHRVSTPNIPYYDFFCIGHVNENGVIIDNQKLGLVDNGRIITSECNNCFAKYNCAGGCLSEKKIYPEIHHAKCDFTRKMLSLQLLEVVYKKT